MHLPWRDLTINDGPAIPTSITEDETDQLAMLATGQDVLEIGSAYGYSAVVMATAGARSIVAVDPHTWLQSQHSMMCNLDSYHVSGQVRIIAEVSASAMIALRPRRFGLIFVDGDHGYEGVRSDVLLALELLAEGGVLACHDYMETCCCPGVRLALDHLFPNGPDLIIDTLALYHPEPVGSLA